MVDEQAFPPPRDSPNSIMNFIVLSNFIFYGKLQIKVKTNAYCKLYMEKVIVP